MKQEKLPVKSVHDAYSPNRIVETDLIHKDPKAYLKQLYSQVDYYVGIV